MAAGRKSLRNCRVISYLLVAMLVTGSFGFILLAGSTEAQTPPVNPNYIQNKIDAANEGDTIWVEPGTYNPIVIDKEVTIISNNSAETIIDGQGSLSVITIVSDWVAISNFTVTGSGNVSFDAGIMMAGVNNCTVENMTITGNRYGMFLTACYGNIIHSNNFINNTHQAYDDGVNTWYVDEEVGGGNYWDDSEAEDDDGDGLMDTAYTIIGGTNKDSRSWAEQNGWLSFEPEDKIEVNALSMMFIGMGVVFSILTILWISTHITGVIFQKFEAKNKAKAGQGGAGESETVAAIVAAIDTRRE